MNFLDGGAHYYDTYETADNKWIAVGAIEPQFYNLPLSLAEIGGAEFQAQNESTKWPILKEKMAKVFKSKTRDEWCSIMEGTDACFAPVLSMEETPTHHHNIARNAFINVDGKIRPAPAPRFSRTQPEIRTQDSRDQLERVLDEWGFSKEQIASLKSSRLI